MMFKEAWDYLRNNHIAMMAVCCLLPVIAIMALRWAGFDGWWIYPLALAICVGSHAAMMLIGGGKKCH